MSQFIHVCINMALFMMEKDVGHGKSKTVQLNGIDLLCVQLWYIKQHYG